MDTNKSVSDARWASLQNVRVVVEPADVPAERRMPPPNGGLRSTATSAPGNGQSQRYQSYRANPFTRAERERTTLLFGGLHWRAERVMQGAIESLGYKTRILPTATREDLLTGREVADVGQCCPTSFTTGSLINFLRDEATRVGPAAVVDDYVYLTAGSCGACRFGQYHQSYELALRNIGMDAFRMFLLDQGNLDQGACSGGGLDLNLPFIVGVIWAIVLTDVVQDLEYQTRPYEIEGGTTDRVVRESIEYLYEVFLKRPHRGRKWGAVAWFLTTDYFVTALAEVRRRFESIEVDRLRVKPVVKITGEFYLQTVEGAPNYDIHRWLETEGAEVYPAAVTVWLDYLLRLAAQDLEDHIGLTPQARLKLHGVRALQGALRWTHRRMRRALGDVPRALPNQSDLRQLAAPYYSARLTGGEGDMLIGKALWAYHHKKAHMTCELSPYSCMPNTMSVGAMAAVLGTYPDLLYAPLEVKGDAEVHALSRCQMILTEAKKRARREYEDVIERTGVADGALQRALQARPHLRRAASLVPRAGTVAGTAANLALHLAAEPRTC